MSPRTTSKTVTFALPFLLKGVDRVLPAGDYRVVTDEELMEGLSFPVYRRVSTMILVPTESRQAVEMLTVDPLDLQVAQDRDVAAHQTAEADPLRNAPDSSPKIGAVPAHAAVMERKVVCNLVNVDFGRFVRESVVAIPLHSARHLGKFSTLPFPDVESSLREISYLIA